MSDSVQPIGNQNAELPLPGLAFTVPLSSFNCGKAAFLTVILPLFSFRFAVRSDLAETAAEQRGSAFLTRLGLPTGRGSTAG
jgi:hypothetical protein